MDWEIDRNALVQFYTENFYQQTRDSVAKGELTFAEAAVAHRKFVESDALQQIVNQDVDRLTAQLNGRVH